MQKLESNIRLTEAIQVKYLCLGGEYFEKFCLGVKLDFQRVAGSPRNEV